MEITMNYGRLGLDVTPVLWQVKDKGFFQSAFEFDCDYNAKEFYALEKNFDDFIEEVKRGEWEKYPCNPVAINGLPSRIGWLQIAINYYMRHYKDTENITMLVYDHSRNELELIDL